MNTNIWKMIDVLIILFGRGKTDLLLVSRIADIKKQMKAAAKVRVGKIKHCLSRVCTFSHTQSITSLVRQHWGF